MSSIAVARTREALYNSWDKNDPKDAQVILHLLKNGTTQRYLDPLVTGHQDLQEMANTYQQVSLRKVRLQHSLLTHHLPLYFPEAERYLHSSRAEWFTELLLFTAAQKIPTRLQLDEMAADGQSQPQGAVVASRPSIRVAEAFEQMREELRGNTDAVVGDGHLDVARIGQ